MKIAESGCCWIMVCGVAEHKAVPIHASALGSMVGRNLTMLGSVNANTHDWQMAVRNLAEMRISFPGVVEALVTHRFGWVRWTSLSIVLQVKSRRSLS